MDPTRHTWLPDDEAVALAHYTEFKNEVVSQLGCTGRDIEAILRETSDDAVAPSI